MAAEIAAVTWNPAAVQIPLKHNARDPQDEGVWAAACHRLWLLPGLCVNECLFLSLFSPPCALRPLWFVRPIAGMMITKCPNNRNEATSAENLCER